MLGVWGEYVCMYICLYVCRVYTVGVCEYMTYLVHSSVMVYRRSILMKNMAGSEHCTTQWQ